MLYSILNTSGCRGPALNVISICACLRHASAIELLSNIMKCRPRCMYDSAVSAWSTPLEREEVRWRKSGSVEKMKKAWKEHERKRRGKKKQRERERERERVCVCVYVHMCVICMCEGQTEAALENQGALEQEASVEFCIVGLIRVRS